MKSINSGVPIIMATRVRQCWKCWILNKTGVLLIIILISPLIYLKWYVSRFSRRLVYALLISFTPLFQSDHVKRSCAFFCNILCLGRLRALELACTCFKGPLPAADAGSVLPLKSSAREPGKITGRAGGEYFIYRPLLRETPWVACILLG